MFSQEFEKERLKNKGNRLEAEIFVTRKVRYTRIFFSFLTLLFLPLQLPLHIILIVIAAVSKHHKSTLIYNYLKLHFKVFFYFSGTEIFNVYPIPRSIPTPSIFFTIRSTNLSTPFLQTQFQKQINLPYQKRLAEIPIHPLFPVLRMGLFAKSYGYRDNPLDKNMQTIESLLLQKKPIVIYINPHICDPQFSETLLLYKSVLELLNTSINCFFIKANLLESYKIGTFFHKTPISIYCKEATQVIGKIKNTEDDKIETSLKIMEFFEFKNVRLV